MFRHLLRRRARRSRTAPVGALLRTQHRDTPPAWRRPLAWAALLTLVASALYFSVTDRDVDKPTPALAP
jgi:hypothetical protein